MRFAICLFGLLACQTPDPGKSDATDQTPTPTTTTTGTTGGGTVLGQPGGDAGDADADADGDADSDLDGDGFTPPADCDETDPNVHPGVPDVTCDGVDQNCNGLVDENAQMFAFCPDADNDGFGDPLASVVACSQPLGFIPECSDCDDSDAGAHPGAAEVANGQDDDCDLLVDEGVNTPTTWYQDADGDGFGNAAVTLLSVPQPPGYVAVDSDCNDLNPAIHPGAVEVCNGLDDNCGGVADNGLAFITYCDDDDGDAFGDPSDSQYACAVPPGFIAECSDCNDASSSVHPGALEIGNGLDDDCDTFIDEGVVNPTTWYQDLDGDAYGNSTVSTSAVAQPAGYVALAGDCIDTNGAIHPGALEICDSVDNDCDLLIDESCGGGTTTWYFDGDGDGYGNGAVTMTSVVDPGTAWVPVDSDCNDVNAAIHPLALEACNGLDDDCDGIVDETCGGGCAFADDLNCDGIVFPDNDNDGHGQGNWPTSTGVANPAMNWSDVGDDCDDGNASTWTCTGGGTNDDDGDGYVDVSNGGTDCDDTDALVHPGAVEKWDVQDNDCNGSADNLGLVRWYRCYADHADIAVDIDNSGSNETYDVMEHWFSTSNSCVGGLHDGFWMDLYPSDICTNATYAPGNGCVESGGEVDLWGGAYTVIALSQCSGQDPYGLYLDLALPENTGVNGEFAFYNGDPDMDGDGTDEQFTCTRLGFGLSLHSLAATWDDLSGDTDLIDPVEIWRHGSAPFDGAPVLAGINPGDVMFSSLENEAEALGYDSHLDVFGALNAAW